MAFPSHSEIGEALKAILVARANRPLSFAEAYELLADRFQIDWRQKRLKIRGGSGAENKWQSMCRTARADLVKQGVLNREPWDTWTLTAAAFRGLQSSPDELGL